MKKFVKIFVDVSPFRGEDSINRYAENMSCEIVAASTTISQGVFYTTVVFEKKAKSASKKEEGAL